jgi:hypothetical protein
MGAPDSPGAPILRFALDRLDLVLRPLRNMSSRRPSFRPLLRRLGTAGLVQLACAAPLAVYAQPAHPAACPPRPTANGPAFIAGNEAGNLKHSSMKLWADGSVQVRGGPRSAPDTAIADSVATLAAFARGSAFWARIAAPIARPTRNPDMARHYVEAHLRCGTKRSLYPADAEPADFHTLFSRLAALARLASSR